MPSGQREARSWRAGWLALLALAMLLTSACANRAGEPLSTPSPAPTTSPTASPSPTPPPLAPAFAAASARFGVPQPLLLAVSYVETRWYPDLAGSGYGIMDLFDTPRHDGTLTRAATALGIPATTLKTDTTQNILGGAAILAAEAKTCGSVPAPTARLSAWYCAVAGYPSVRYQEPAKQFADYVFAVLRGGAQGEAADGETLSIAPQSAQPNPTALAALGLPHLPAATPDYAEATAVETGIGYGDGNRPSDGQAIQYIIIHDTEEGYLNTLRIFTDPDTCCAANYVVDGADGGAFPTVTQFVPEREVAYHAGNLYYNRHAIGIENVGFVNAPNGFYTPEMYQATARLVAALCHKYAIPLDRAHILGHGNVPGPTPDAVSQQHYDPGSFWDWPYFLALVRQDYAQLSGNAAPPAAALPARYTAPRSSIRVITANGTHSAESDVPTWEANAYSDYTLVYADTGGKPGSALIRGASDPTTAVDKQHYNARDFSCDNPPDQPVGDFANPLNTSFDLRAKAEYGEAFALLGTYTAPDGTRWDKIDFNGLPGWIRDSDTSDGWGAIVTFGKTTTIAGDPGDGPICADAANGYSRAGQSYVAQQTQTDSTGALWYALYYNHHVVWAPATEVTVS